MEFGDFEEISWCTKESLDYAESAILANLHLCHKWKRNSQHEK